MRKRGLVLQGRLKTAFVAASVLLSFLGILAAGSAFLADRFASRAEDLLDDPQTEYRDVRDISEESLVFYREAIDAYRKAVKLAPLDGGYAASLGDLYERIDAWKTTMKEMGKSVDHAGGEEGERARTYLLKAEALDPAGSGRHLALGELYADEGERSIAVWELMRAVDVYPISAQRRYAVAMRLFLMGERNLALQQAAVLARIDDSYRIDDDDPASVQMREQRLPGYKALLENSYLYKAMELTWRITGKDAEAVRSIVPDGPDARETLRLFFVQKGVNQD